MTDVIQMEHDQVVPSTTTSTEALYDAVALQVASSPRFLPVTKVQSLILPEVVAIYHGHYHTLINFH